MAALQALVDAGVEELRVIQTVFLMASIATFIKGKVLVKVHVCCVCLGGVWRRGGGGGEEEETTWKEFGPWVVSTFMCY